MVSLQKYLSEWYFTSQTPLQVSPYCEISMLEIQEIKTSYTAFGQSSDSSTWGSLLTFIGSRMRTADLTVLIQEPIKIVSVYALVPPDMQMRFQWTSFAYGNIRWRFTHSGLIYRDFHIYCWLIKCYPIPGDDWVNMANLGDPWGPRGRHGSKMGVRR